MPTFTMELWDIKPLHFAGISFPAGLSLWPTRRGPVVRSKASSSPPNGLKIIYIKSTDRQTAPKQRSPSNRYLRTILTTCAMRVSLVPGSTGNRLRAFSEERTNNQLHGQFTSKIGIRQLKYFDILSYNSTSAMPIFYDKYIITTLYAWH